MHVYDVTPCYLEQYYSPTLVNSYSVEVNFVAIAMNSGKLVVLDADNFYSQVKSLLIYIRNVHVLK